MTVCREHNRLLSVRGEWEQIQASDIFWQMVRAGLFVVANVVCNKCKRKVWRKNNDIDR